MSEPQDEADVSVEADRTVEAEPEVDARVFSFACFPMERVLVLIGVLAGPAIAAVVSLRYRAMDQMAGRHTELVSYELGDARLLVGATALLAVVLVVYGVLYLQLRAATEVRIDTAGVHLTRRALLPFGLLGLDRFVGWDRVVRAELVERRTWMGVKRPLLEVVSARRDLRLSVADAWPEPGPRRPWAPKPPEGGWARHPLVAVATSSFAEAALAAKVAPSLKSESTLADSSD